MDNLWHLFQAGGFMMAPILLCSLAAAAIGAERFLLYRERLGNLPRLTAAAETLCGTALEEALRGDRSSAAAVLREAALRGPASAKERRLEAAAAREEAALRARLSWLSAIVTLAPLLGLLGTVMGMMQSFRILSEGSAPFAVTGGVAEALVCTAFGLFTAVLALVLHAFLTERLERILFQIEQVCDLCLVAGAERP